MLSHPQRFLPALRFSNLNMVVIRALVWLLLPASDTGSSSDSSLN
jgi:hypothetical protein